MKILKVFKNGKVNKKPVTLGQIKKIKDKHYKVNVYWAGDLNKWWVVLYTGALNKKKLNSYLE